MTYRDPEGLARTFESLCAVPAGLSWEWLVVDSSPELNQSILEKARAADFPLVHIPTPARGIYSAMRTGLQQAAGEFIWFLNGGDELDSPAAFQTVLAEAQNEKAGILWAAVKVMEDGQLVRFHRATSSLKSELWGINRVCHQGLLFARQCFLAPLEGFPEGYRVVADYVHLLECVREGVKVVPSKAVLARFYLGGASDRVMPAIKEFGRVHRENRAHLSATERIRHLISWVLASWLVLVKRNLRELPLGKSLRAWHNAERK